MAKFLPEIITLVLRKLFRKQNHQPDRIFCILGFVLCFFEFIFLHNFNKVKILFSKIIAMNSMAKANKLLE